MSSERRQRTYDHRLIQLVQEMGDVTLATQIDGTARQGAAGVTMVTVCAPSPRAGDELSNRKS